MLSQVSISVYGGWGTLIRPRGHTALDAVWNRYYPERIRCIKACARGLRCSFVNPLICFVKINKQSGMNTMSINKQNVDESTTRAPCSYNMAPRSMSYVGQLFNFSPWEGLFSPFRCWKPNPNLKIGCISNLNFIFFDEISQRKPSSRRILR